MKYYEIKINGYGGELVNGKVTKEQYEFWVEQNEETLSHHVFYDPYDETKENLIHDDKDPRFLGYWHDLDDIIHENGADLGSAYIEINEVNKSNARLKDVVERVGPYYEQNIQPLINEKKNVIIVAHELIFTKSSLCISSSLPSYPNILFISLLFLPIIFLASDELYAITPMPNFLF